jgi:ribosomal protein L6P/L9E
MSRIGKKPVPLPAGVTATIAGTTVTVKGPKGSLSRTLPAEMLVTLAGMMRLGRLEQFSKASTPMRMTPLGIVTLVRLVQRENAEKVMLVTPFGIT